MAASPFETPPFGRLLRVRPPGKGADFLILRASAASVSKDGEICFVPYAIALDWLRPRQNEIPLEQANQRMIAYTARLENEDRQGPIDVPCWRQNNPVAAVNMNDID